MSFDQEAQVLHVLGAWIAVVSRPVVQEPAAARGIRRAYPVCSGYHGGQLDD